MNKLNLRILSFLMGDSRGERIKLPLPLGEGWGEGIIRFFIISFFILLLPHIPSAAPIIFSEDDLHLSFTQSATDTVILDGTYEIDIQHYSEPIAVIISDQLNNQLSQETVSDYIESGTKTLAIFSIPIEQPIYWNAEKPYLYNIQLSTNESSLNTSFGISLPRASQNQFLLNDTPIHLRAVHYQINTSRPITHALNDLELIKAANANAIFLNNPNPPHIFLSKCDEIGLYVILKATPLTFELDYKGVTSHPAFLMWLVDGDISHEDYLRMTSLDPHQIIVPIIQPGSLSTLPSDLLAIQNITLDELNPLYQLNKPILLFSALSGDAINHIIPLTQALLEPNNLFGITIDQFHSLLPTPSETSNTLVYPSANYHVIKNAYSPVKFVQNQVQLNPGRRIVEAELINQFDFTNLQELSATWQLQFDSVLQFTNNVVFNLEPGERMKAAFPVDLPNEFPEHETYLTILFESGKKEIHRHGIWIQPPNWQRNLLLRLNDLKYDVNWEVTANTNQSIINHELFKYDIQANPLTWFLLIKETNTRLITGGPFLITQRMVDGQQQQYTFENLSALHRSIDRVQQNNIEIKHPIIIQDATSQLSHTQIDMLASPYGYVDVKWILEAQDNHQLTHATLEFLIPSTLQNVTWSGLGPHPVEPDLESLMFYGIFKFDLLNQFFDGNRHNTRAIALTDKRNYGLGIILLNGNLGLTRSEEGTRVQINTYFSDHTRSIPGTNEVIFRLIPILRNNYPNWFHQFGRN